jgi:tetratricopeptide (TPR) repeat protein
LLSIAHRLAAEVYLGSAGTRGDALVEHHFSQALEWARRGQAAEPASDRPPTAEAECLESMGRFAEAVAARTQAIAAATKDVSRWEGYHYRWRLRYWLGDFAGALSDLAACAAFDPDNRFYAYVYPALVRAESGDRAGALAQARALAEEHPHNPQDQLWAATCLRLLGQETAARDLLQGPAGADLDFTSGLVPPQTPEWVRALYAYACAGGSPQDLEESTLQVSGSWRLWGELHFHTGALHLAQGDRSRALSAFRRAYRSFDSERRYTYHAKLICIQMDADPTWPHWIDGVEHEPEAPATASEAAAPPAALIEREESYVER